jgi:uncharacterized protein (DUF2062 family)
MTAAWRRLLDLLRRARAEHASRLQISVAVAAGLFACCSPLLGFHCFLALALATLFRVNRLSAAVASQASIFGILRPPIVFAEIELGHHLRLGSWAPLDLATIVERAPSLMLDWAIGSVPFGLTVSALGGLLAWACLARPRAKHASPKAPGRLEGF